MARTSWIKLLVPVCGALVFAVTAGNEKGGCTPTPPEVAECTVPADCDGLPHDLCLGGWQCISGECAWECDGPQKECVASGCSGEVCASEPVYTPCVWKDEFECLKLTKCGAFADGSCGFDPNPDYLKCLEDHQVAKPCTSDQECGGFVCVNGKCVEPLPECGPDLPCPAGFACVEVADCPPCVYEPPYCKIACKVKYQCEPVAQGCHSDNDCKPEEHCSISDGDCQPDPTCPMCAVCYGTCVPDAVGCTADSQCPAGYYCQLDYSCGGGYDPATGEKKPGPGAPEYCEPTGQCAKKTDPNECYSDADCPKGQVCLWPPCEPCACDPAAGTDCACPPCMGGDHGFCHPAGCTDMDGDGWCSGEDCDDYNPATSPGAPEICDDWTDNNCNGIVDEDCTQKPQCWSDADCQWYEHCALPYAYDEAGVMACCPANAKCTAEIPPCGAGVCVMDEGLCWNDKDCPAGTYCENMVNCGPDMNCMGPYKCVPGGPTCTAVKPGSHGDCKMLIGWIFNGTACVPEGGCGCEPDCGAFFDSQAECEAACGTGPTGCTSDAECAKGEYCDFSGIDFATCCPPGAMCLMIYEPCLGTCMPLTPACETDSDCGIGSVCVNGMCMMQEGLCWDDSYCKPGYHCEGAIVCPPGAYCFVADQPGKCVPDAADACTWDAQCAQGEFCDFGGYADMPGCCVPLDPTGAGCPAGYPVCPGTCRLLDGRCWTDADCKYGSHCEGAFVCPEGALCGPLPNKAGECVADATCVAVKPYSHGMCEMFLGFIFDGSKCVGESGCGCGADCAHIFKTQEACEAACGVQPPPTGCQSDWECKAGQYCNVACAADGWCKGECQAVPAGACVKDADCGTGAVCVIEACPACWPCPCFGTCQKVEPPAPCTSDDECAKGQFCKLETICPDCVYANPPCMMPCKLSGTCTTECWVDTDCPQGFYCYVTKCAPGEKCIGPYECRPLVW